MVFKLTSQTNETWYNRQQFLDHVFGDTMFQEHYEMITAPIKNHNTILPLTTSHHTTKGNVSPFPPHRV